MFRRYIPSGQGANISGKEDRLAMIELDDGSINTAVDNEMAKDGYTPADLFFADPDEVNRAGQASSDGEQADDDGGESYESSDESFGFIAEYKDKYEFDPRCNKCGLAFPSRNKLMTHARQCLSEGYHQVSEEKWEKPTVKSLPWTNDNPRAHQCGYTYARINVRGSLNGPTFEICADTGASRCVIAKRLLREIENCAVDWTRKCYLNGVGGSEAIGWAIFTLYVKGTIDGRPAVGALHIGAWVVKNLDAGILLGQEFNVPNGLDILNSEGLVKIRSCSTLCVPARIFSKVKEAIFRVKAAANVTIPPRTTQPIQFKTAKGLKFNPSCLDPSEKAGFRA
jgi:hypothetical protein